ncbi:MAG TPA: glucose-1-phosphate cytidylyltransferase, partial [Armatimonadetes bacterium]|nr:glucose-1-phosphate cytidylyltransferase [Armatimonadota bacterium]
MKVVILCGGRGLRLRGEVEAPKPLVEIGGRPILWHVMMGFSHFGFEEFILCLGYRGDAIKEHFMRGEPWREGNFTLEVKGEGSTALKPLSGRGWTVHFVETGLETPTGGRVKRVSWLLEGEPDFFV